ncbi:hypothetical protein P9112_000468 [Eukaryota sp. TZLM1-RC]
MATHESKRVIPGPIELDTQQKCLRVKYDLEVNQLDANTQVISSSTQPKEKIVKLEHLITAETNASELAVEIVQKLSKIVSSKQTPLVTQLLQQLQRSLFAPPPLQIPTSRHSSRTTSSATSRKSNDTPSPTPFPFLNILSLPATTNQLDSYLSLFYNELSDKEDGAAHIACLALKPSNIPLVTSNHAVISALSRTLSEDYKKSVSLSLYISLSFLSFSYYEDFIHFLSDYDVDSMILKYLSTEVKRFRVLQNDIKEKKKEGSSIDRDVIKVRNQTRLLTAYLAMIINLIDGSDSFLSNIDTSKFISKLFLILKIQDPILSWLCLLIIQRLSLVKFWVELLFNSNLLSFLVTILDKYPNIPSEFKNSVFKVLINLFHNDQLRQNALSEGIVPVLVKMLTFIVDKMFNSGDNKVLLSDFNYVTKIIYQLSLDSEFQRLFDRSKTFDDVFDLALKSKDPLLLALVSNLFSEQSRQVDDVMIDRFITYFGSSVSVLIDDRPRDVSQKRDILTVLYCLTEVLDYSEVCNPQITSIISQKVSRDFIQFLVNCFSLNSDSLIFMALTLLGRIFQFDCVYGYLLQFKIPARIVELMFNKIDKIEFSKAGLMILSKLIKFDAVSEFIVQCRPFASFFNQKFF